MLVSVTITICLFLLLVFYFYSTIQEYASGVFSPPRTAEDKQRLITEASGIAQIAEVRIDTNTDSKNEMLLAEISRSIEDSVWHESPIKKINKSAVTSSDDPVSNQMV